MQRAHIENGVSCQGAEFHGRASFRGNFNGIADFKRTIFYEMPSFSYTDAHQWEFQGARFEKGAKFHSSAFRSLAVFQNICFNEVLSFSNSIFHCIPNFSGIKGSTLDFSGSKFLKNASFSNMFLRDLLNFERTNFEGDAEFINIEARTFTAANANFTNHTVLNECKVRETASFERTFFGGSIDFESSLFFGETNFRKSIFEDQTFFDRAVFSSVLNFKSCRFLSQVSFTETCFSKYFPNFKNCIFKENVTFSASHPFWPPISTRATREARNSLNTIRHLVSKQGFIEDEHYFFRREMALAARLGTLRQRLPYWLFGLLSDFGNSIHRPGWALLITWFMGFASYLGYLCWPQNTEALSCEIFGSTSKAAGFSFSNVFGFLGFNRLYFSPEELFALPTVLKVIAASQTVAGAILIFLLGLGLRNRFRLK